MQVMKRRLTTMAAIVVLILTASVLVAVDANAAQTGDGCAAYAGTPGRYGTTQMSYGGDVTCNQVKAVDEISISLTNEYFQSGATNPSWTGIVKNNCYYNPMYCNAAGGGPWKGHGQYCTVIRALLYVEITSLVDRWCVTL